jgi:hypothetical protein
MNCIAIVKVAAARTSTIWRAAASVLVALSGSPALAEASLPHAVQVELDQARSTCARQGGQAKFGAEMVRRLDLDGDGRDDYLIDSHAAECEGVAGFFCGTGGCDLTILVALGRDRYRQVFTGNVRSYEILPGKGAKSIRFELHGSFCGGFGSSACSKVHRISAKPFKYEQP